MSDYEIFITVKEWLSDINWIKVFRALLFIEFFVGLILLNYGWFSDNVQYQKIGFFNMAIGAFSGGFLTLILLDL